MKWSINWITVLLLLLTGCSGGKDKPLSGTAIITSELFGTGPYYSYGFSFTLADKVSTLSDPEPDFSVEAGVIPGSPDVVPFLSANTFKPSFGLKGEYASESEAVAAFNALTEVGTPSWTDMGAPLKVNQVWVIRTGDTKYAKIRTMGVILEQTGDGPVAKCTFQWVFQPDGSPTFPGS
ncbi:MAG TPA: hypothetical protein VMV74_05550 [Bacteroidales bacterium]|nr:hypothetical protein [Bacteroidales bacterium]